MKKTGRSSAVPNIAIQARASDEFGPGFPPRPATAAGLFGVWSTIRLEMMRGCEFDNVAATPKSVLMTGREVVHVLGRAETRIS